VRRNHHVAGAVQDTLGLGQVVALQQGCGGWRVKAREHLLLWQIGIQPGTYRLGTDLTPQLVAERSGHNSERGGAALRTRERLRGQRNDTLAYGGRIERTAHLEGAESGL